MQRKKGTLLPSLWVRVINLQGSEILLGFFMRQRLEIINLKSLQTFGDKKTASIDRTTNSG